MKWDDYQAARKTLHIAYHAAKRVDDRAKMAEMNAARDALEDEHERFYDLEGTPILGPEYKLRARVGFAGMQPWLQIQSIDEGGQVNLYATEFGTIPSTAMQQLVHVQRYVERYIAGEIDELPADLPVFRTAPYSCPLHPNAAAGAAVGCIDCIPATP